ncbi:MAG: hypothetical protein M5Z89_15035 [Olivibacter sp.]|nr:hypothetical protein [Olivibacter sp. UJ_SKK_5.1]
MTKFPFTRNGTEQLFAALYQLDDRLLQQEAAWIQADFQHWLKDHYLLNEDQLNYVNKLSENFIRSTAPLCSVAIRNRLPIILDKPNEKVHVRRGKLVDTKNNIQSQYDEGENLEITGELTFTIRY